MTTAVKIIREGSAGMANGDDVMGQHRRCGCVDVLWLLMAVLSTVDGNNGSGRQLATTVKASLLAVLSPPLALSNYDDGRGRSVEEPLPAS